MAANQDRSKHPWVLGCQKIVKSSLHKKIRYSSLPWSHKCNKNSKVHPRPQNGREPELRPKEKYPRPRQYSEMSKAKPSGNSHISQRKVNDRKVRTSSKVWLLSIISDSKALQWSPYTVFPAMDLWETLTMLRRLCESCIFIYNTPGTRTARFCKDRLQKD